MNLQTSTTPAVENCEPVVESYDLKLLGPHHPFGPDNCFCKVFNKDSKFYYRVEQIKNNIVIKYEVGLGYIEDNVLKRFRPLYHGNNLSDIPSPSSNGPQFFLKNPDEHLIVSSHIPRLFGEAFCDANTVVSSVAPFVPHPVTILENSCLGRLDDNVQSIPFSSLFSSKEFIEMVLQAIISYASQLSLNTSKLDAKRISTDSLQLNKTKKPLMKQGSMVFDGENIKFYDGENWKVLQWRIENE